MKTLPRILLLAPAIALLLFWPDFHGKGLRAQASGPHSVALTWTASATDATHAAATGFNVKRGTVTGGPYTTIASPTVTSYTDTTVAGGGKYFYVVTATCPSCAESAPSNEVTATIPLDQLNPPTALAPGVVK